MSDSYTYLANKFKTSINEYKLGCVLAEVVEPLPDLKLKLLNGNMELDVELDGDNIFIARSITNRKEISVTFKDFESKKNKSENSKNKSNTLKSFSASSGNITHPTPIPTKIGPQMLAPTITNIDLPNISLNELSSSNTENEKETKEKGKMTIQMLVTLEKGDKVLVVPNFEEDQFYIVDVFDNVKKVVDEWEYYPKD